MFGLRPNNLTKMMTFFVIFQIVRAQIKTKKKKREVLCSHGLLQSSLAWKYCITVTHLQIASCCILCGSLVSFLLYINLSNWLSRRNFFVPITCLIECLWDTLWRNSSQSLQFSLTFWVHCSKATHFTSLEDMGKASRDKRVCLEWNFFSFSSNEIYYVLRT